jgi:hypothetical protein
MNLTDYPDWAQPLIVWGSILAVIGVLFGFVRKIWPAVKKMVKLTDSLDNLPQFMITTAATLEQQDVKIEQIHHEVNYNNGSSVKDAVKRVEIGVADMLTQQEKDRKLTAESLTELKLRLTTADTDRRELREDLEKTAPRPPARKRPTKPKETL